MAKTIKFNLICDEYPVRTIEDLQEHFSLEDVWEYYETERLQRWLEVRGYEKELKEVKKITSDNAFEIMDQLIRIFHIETDDEKIREGVYALQYQRERWMKNFEQRNQAAAALLSRAKYNRGYNQLVKTILENSTDMAFVKAAVRELHDEYMSIYQCDYNRLFQVLYEWAPMALFVMLSYEAFRDKMLTDEVALSFLAFDCNDTDISYRADALKAASEFVLEYYQSQSKKYSGDDRELAALSDRYHDADEELHSDEAECLRNTYDQLCDLLTELNLRQIFGDNLREYTGDTEGCWDDPEPRGKKCMILYMSGGRIRSAGNHEQLYRAEDIKNAFVILDGIEYQNSDGVQTVLYMEV